MAYVKPMVMVYQEYANTSGSTASASLPPCIIGPCYHIIDPLTYSDDYSLAEAKTAYTEESAIAREYAVDFPGNAAGALIDKSSAYMLLKNAYVRTCADTGIPYTASTMLVGDAKDTIKFGSKAAFPTVIAVGDIVKFGSTSFAGKQTLVDREYVVKSITTTEESYDADGNIVVEDVYTITLNRSLDVASLSEATMMVTYRIFDKLVFEYGVENPVFGIDEEAEQFTVDSAIPYAELEGIDGSENNAGVVVSGQTYFGYRALRQDLSSLQTISDANDIESKLGKICSRNPLAMGVNVCLANTTTDVMFVGVDSDDLAGYTAAKDRIETKDPCYGIVPLTRQAGILSMFKNHCESMSQYNKCQWRVCLGNSELKTTTELCDFRASIEQKANVYRQLRLGEVDANKDVAFIDNDVDAGDAIVFYLADADGNMLVDTDGNKINSVASYVVSSVPSDNLLVATTSKTFETPIVLEVATVEKIKSAYTKLAEENSGNTALLNKFLGKLIEVKVNGVLDHFLFTLTDYAGLTQTTYTSNKTEVTAAETPVSGALLRFRVVHTLDKSDQASDIAATSKSYGSSRFVHVWPDVCYIDDEAVPGYYLCCAVAGGISSLPSHYGFTNLSMSGIDAVKHSADYFNQEQLDTIAGGGTFIFVQDSEASVPYVRHQLTTDISTVEFQELSFVKNFDYVSYICRDVLRPFIGKWNITNNTLESIKVALTSALETLKLASVAKIGAPVISYSITSVKQLDSTRDRVEAYVDVVFPYPLNTIGLHLVSN